MTEVLPQQAVKQLRTAGLVLPRPPYPGQKWTPRTPAEEHLLGEATRLDHARRLLLAELGRIRQVIGYRPGAQVREDTAREAERLKECPLTPTQLRVVAAAVEGLDIEETAARLHISWHTAKNHRTRAQAAVGARSFVHLAALCVQAGWVLVAPARPEPGVTL